MARRLVERGVRMVQVYHTETSKRKSCQLWDQHSGLKEELPTNCAAVDKPIAGLLKDLKARGLLDDTIVMWTTEFGRMPCSQGAKGRDHNPFTFTTWLAGGGIKGGVTYGESDEWSYKTAAHPAYCYDVHATILHLLGIDHTKLTFRHNGIDRRLTDVHGDVINELFKT